jgi:predicted permease
MPMKMNLPNDLRFALRSLAKNPLFTIGAVLILAIGIAMNTFVFSVVNAQLFKDLAFDRNGHVLYLMSGNTLRDDAVDMVSYPDFRDWQANSRSFQDMAAFAPKQSNISDDASLPESCRSAAITSNAFRLLGQQPTAGRDFTPLDEKPGAPRVVMLSYGLWNTRYGGAPSIIGQTVRIDQIPTTVIGVMPPDWSFPNDVDLWFPLTLNSTTEERGARNLIVYGLLADKATMQTARAEMEKISRDLSAAYPQTNSGIIASVRTFREQYVGPTTTSRMMLMLYCVILVMLITCANVGSLVLARGIGRASEISLRLALGAGRWQIVRLLLIESLLLSGIGALMGWQLAEFGLRAFDRLITMVSKPRWLDLSLDYHVALYIIAITVGTCLLFGIVPAIWLSRPNMRLALNSGRGAIAGGRPGLLSFRSLLPTLETALALVLVAGTGVLVRGYLSSARAPLGVDPSNVLTMRLSLPQSKYADRDAQVRFFEQLKTGLQNKPGVESVSLASSLPTTGSLRFTYQVDGRAPIEIERRPAVNAVLVDSDYFRVWRVEARQGRVFTDADGFTAQPVVLINQAFAHAAWPQEDPIGKRLELFGTRGTGFLGTVVGVVPNIVQNDIGPRQIDQLVYLSFRQYRGDSSGASRVATGSTASNFQFRMSRADQFVIIARTRVVPETLAATFRSQVHAIDPDMPVLQMRSMADRIFRNHFPEQTLTVIFTVFSGFSLLLAGMGLYAVIAHSVRERTQEIGLRMALGASRWKIVGVVLTQAMRCVGIGAAIGLAGAWPFGRLLSSLIAEASPNDFVSIAAASALLLVVATLACLFPVYRATRVDPMIALRYQ